MTNTSRIAGIPSAGSTKRVPVQGAVPGHVSTWGRTWGDTWGAAWGAFLPPVAASPALDLTPRVSALAQGGQTPRVSGALSLALTQRVLPSAAALLLEEGGELQLEGDESGSLSLEGDEAEAITPSHTKRVTQ